MKRISRGKSGKVDRTGIGDSPSLPPYSLWNEIFANFPLNIIIGISVIATIHLLDILVPVRPRLGVDQTKRVKKLKKDQTGCGNYSHWPIQEMKSVSPENESGVWGKWNLSHLVQHEPLKPLSQSATEWVVELQCHGGGALGKDKSCQINSDWCCQTWKT